jgi:hypothetical protein
MKNIVAKPIHMGADVGRTVVIGMPALLMKAAMKAVIADEPASPINRAMIPLLWCGGMLSPPISIFL